MEADKNPMPELHLFPRLEAVGRFIGKIVRHLPEVPLASHGDHFVNTGGGPALDRALYGSDE